MTTFVALLRGINVGGKNRIPMAELRSLCERLGYRNVRTLIQSGNVVLDGRGKPAALEADLERGIARSLGLEIPVVARTAESFASCLALNPLREASASDPSHVLLGLSKSRPTPGAARALQERATAGERIEVVGEALWFHYPLGVGRSKLTPALIDRLVGSTVTARNVTTATKLVELAGGGQ
jgi:uncharacterized protein (DUF1697 family)